MRCQQNGQVKCWGDNTFGQLGNKSTAPESLTPVAVVKNDGAQLENITQVSLGEDYSCALGGDGHIWCWGTNTLDQLGIDTSGEGVSYASHVSETDSSPFHCQVFQRV